MIEFVIKSTICLGGLFGFYHFLLRDVKIPVFNRFYLLFSLVFAIVIPLINIRMNLNVSFNPDIHKISNETGILIQGEKVTGKPVQPLTFQSILILFYAIISFLLLLRFILNIFKIIKLIRTSPRVNNQKTQLILVEKTALPYSFWRTIFVNRSDYENGKIENELIIHEQAHCMQYHSIDIIAIELVKIMLWFNPFVWFFRKAIQLNHEYLADNKVLSDHDLYDYQNTLVNLVFRNNSTYLASNFNYSLTKKRLIMMTKNRTKSVAYKIAMVPVLAALIFYFISCSKELKETANSDGYDKTAWWSPILLKHNIKRVRSNAYNNLIEMGSTNSIDNNIVRLDNAFFLIRQGDDKYLIIRSSLAYHDLKKNIIEGADGTIETYSFKSKDTKPLETFASKNFKYQLKDSSYKAERIEFSKSK